MLAVAAGSLGEPLCKEPFLSYLGRAELKGPVLAPQHVRQKTADG